MTEKEALAQASWRLAIKTSIRLLIFCLGHNSRYLTVLHNSLLVAHFHQRTPKRKITALAIVLFPLCSLRHHWGKQGATGHWPPRMTGAFEQLGVSVVAWVPSGAASKQTPQRPKILKPPPNHPPPNKPPNRIQASASRSHRFPIPPSTPVHVSSPGSAATRPRIIRHSRPSPAKCTRPERVPACCLPAVVISESSCLHCSRAVVLRPTAFLLPLWLPGRPLSRL